MYLAHVNLFDPNPYQPRQEINPTALRELADNIFALNTIRPQTRGLLQLPLARVVGPAGTDVTHVAITNFAETAPTDITVWLDNTNYRLQLALGHRRHAAFALLAPTDPDYLYMPFELAPLTDEDMFQAALSENVARADLNPIELAASMQRYRDEFGKSSKEIGTLFGLSDSAVRNLIRLLDLPEEARTALANGTMSQGTALALLSLYAIPEETRKSLGSFYHADKWGQTHEHIIKAAINGALATTIEDMINQMVKSGARKLEGLRWALSDSFPETDGIIHPDCLTCPYHLERQKTHWCAQSTCFTTKVYTWQRQQLLAASTETGLPIHTGSSSTDFDYTPRKETLPHAQSIQCPNLCLRFSDHKYQRKNEGYEHCTIPGHPGAEIICSKLEQHCTCLQAYKVGLQITPNFPTHPAIDETDPNQIRTSEPAAPPDLKAINRQIKAQKSQAKEEVKAMRETATHRFYTALSTNHLPAWKKLLGIIYGFKDTNELTVEDLLLSVSAFMVNREFQYENHPDTDIELNLRRLNRWLKGMNLDPLGEPLDSPVSTETPTPIISPFEGQPLTEVFAELELETCIHEWTADDHDTIHCAHCGETFDHLVTKNLSH